MSQPELGERFESFRTMLEQRVTAWLASDECRKVSCPELYRHLPELFQLLARLALDARVEDRDRTALRATLKYVVAPFDLIPEGIVGTAGFRDDLVLAAFVLERLEERIDPQVVREHWERPGDPFELAHGILDAATSLVGPDLCARLRAWVPA